MRFWCSYPKRSGHLKMWASTGSQCLDLVIESILPLYLCNAYYIYIIIATNELHFSWIKWYENALPVQKCLMFSHVTQLWINCGSGLNCMQILFFKRDFVRSTVKYFQTWNSQVRLKQSKNSHVNLTFEKWIGNLPLA